MTNITNVTCGRNELSDDQEMFLKNYNWWIDMLGHLPVGLIGVVLNSIAMIVLSTSTMRNNFFNRLLICLAIFDSLYIACEIYEVGRRRYYTSIQQHMFVNFVYPVRNVCMCCSIYSTIAITLERYHAITSPAEYRIRGTVNLGKRLLYYMIPVLVLSNIYYIPKYLDLNVDEKTVCTIGNQTTILNNTNTFNYTNDIDKNCTTKYPLVPTKLRVHPHYVFWYITISNFVVTCIIPLSTMVYLNCRIAISLNTFLQRQPSTRSNDSTNGGRPQQNIDVRRTFILFSIVIIFVLCHSLRIILNFNEFLNLSHFNKEREKGCGGLQFWVEIVVPINQLLIIISSSANFFVYVFFDKGFQKVLRHACGFRSEEHTQTMNITTNYGTTVATRIQNSNEIEMSNINIDQS